MAKISTKADLVAAIAADAAITKKQAETVLATIAKACAAGAKDGFVLPGVAKITVASRKARTGVNPATGAKIKIPARKVVVCKAVKALKDAVCPCKKK